MHKLGYLCLGRAVNDYQPVSNLVQIIRQIVQALEQEAKSFQRN